MAAEMKRSPLKRGRRKRKPQVSKDTIRRVFLRTRGLCCCGCGRSIAPFPMGYHHVWPKARWPDLTDEERNIVGVSEDCHANHESAARRLPRAAIAIAERLPQTPQMERYLDSTYGPRQTRRTPQVAGTPPSANGRPA